MIGTQRDKQNSVSKIINVCRILLQNVYITIKKSNYNIDISKVPELPFDGTCVFLEQWSRWHSDKRANDRYVSQNILWKNGADVLTLC